MKSQDSLTRDTRQITGLWDFCFDPEDCGVKAQWYAGRLPNARKISIYNSYNDIFTEQELHDYVGSIWYQLNVKVPHGWDGNRITLYFESVTHQAMVGADDTLVTPHTGGYTPFEADLTDLVSADFAIDQGLLRVGGNHKGIFNRDQTPKSSAFYLKKRWNH